MKVEINNGNWSNSNFCTNWYSMRWLLLSSVSKKNWKLECWFLWRGKPKNLENKPSEQRQEPLTNSIHMWHKVWEWNLSCSNGSRAHYHYSTTPTSCQNCTKSYDSRISLQMKWTMSTSLFLVSPLKLSFLK